MILHRLRGSNFTTGVYENLLYRRSRRNQIRFLCSSVLLNRKDKKTCLAAACGSWRPGSGCPVVAGPVTRMDSRTLGLHRAKAKQ